MAKNETGRIDGKLLQEDKDSLAGLKTIADYTPVKTEYATEAIQALSDAMTAAQTAETQVIAALRTARDNATAAEWAFHNSILGAKRQVSAQFGDDSNEIQALGLKKKSERKPPTRKNKPAK